MKKTWILANSLSAYELPCWAYPEFSQNLLFEAIGNTNQKHLWCKKYCNNVYFKKERKKRKNMRIVKCFTDCYAEPSHSLLQKRSVLPFA